MGGWSVTRPASAKRFMSSACTWVSSCPMITRPYTVELNDIPMMMVQHHESEAFQRRCTDYFDRLYAEGAETARVMAIAVHPYISGVPHRIKYYEAVYEYMAGHRGVLFWNGEQ